MDNKPTGFAKFTVSVICHFCGLYGTCTLVWLPDFSIGCECMRCGMKEQVSVRSQVQENKPIGLNTDEVGVIKELVKKHKKTTKKELN